MKKILLVIIILSISVTSFSQGGVNNLEKRLELTKFPEELDFKGTLLSEVLSKISKISKVSFLASADIQDLPIDLYLPANQTLKKIIETIKSTNGLSSVIVNDSIIFQKLTASNEDSKHRSKIIGKITEIDKITGIKGVTITLGDDLSTLVMSDVGGAFVMKDVPQGTYIIKATMRNYNPTAEIIEVKPSKNTRVQMIMNRREGGINKSKLRIEEGMTGKVRNISNFSTAEYGGPIEENTFKNTIENSVSTFSIDVDKASYSIIRNQLNNNILPTKSMIRVEEMINYFNYDYKEPKKTEIFSINTELGDCDWNENSKLALIQIKGKKLKEKRKKSNNLVFLIDVSGSMDSSNKLGLIIESLKLLTDKLDKNDLISIVVYSGNEGLALSPTKGKNKKLIKNTLNRLSAGGSTAGGAGIKLAYKIANDNFIKDGNNRVILCTDGDFNVGISDTNTLTDLIIEKKSKGIFLTVVGVGNDNIKDFRLERLADKGDGNYYFLDNINEGKKVFQTELFGTIFTIAKDVKIQVEFNPAKIKKYKLIGYENRMLKKKDFDDDKKDAGELGAGHTVTAIYEIILENSKVDLKSNSYFTKKIIKEDSYKNNELMLVKIRYKKPNEDKSKEIKKIIMKDFKSLKNTSEEFKFASAVAEFGLLLRDSKFKERSSFEKVINLAEKGIGKDKYGYREEFIKLVKKSKKIRNENNNINKNNNELKKLSSKRSISRKEFKNSTYKKILLYLTKEYGVSFSISKDLGLKKTSFFLGQGVYLNEILYELLGRHELKYKINNNTVIIYK